MATLGITVAQGINAAGQIVGQYNTSTGAHGFLLSGGTYTTLDDPLATSGTVAHGINATGQIVGFYANATGFHGFLLNGGMYTTLNDPSATLGTEAFGINAEGQIVGFFNNATGSTRSGHRPDRNPAMQQSPGIGGLSKIQNN